MYIVISILQGRIQSPPGDCPAGDEIQTESPSGLGFNIQMEEARDICLLAKMSHTWFYVPNNN